MATTPYGVSNYVDQITKLRATDPAAAYAMYNGLSSMGGQNSGDAGALTIGLRNAWGEQAARDFVNTGTTKYGNSNFDPTTGKWGGMGEAQGQGGTIAGWDPSQFATGASFQGTYAPPGGTSVATLSGANTRPGATTNPGNPNQPPAGTAPPGTTTPPGTTAPPGSTTPPATGVPTNTAGAGNLQSQAESILGSYLLRNADGTINYDGMANNAFFFSLPPEMQKAASDVTLFKRMRAAVNTNAYGTPAGAAPTYTPPNYTAPPQQAVSAGNPMDFYNDEGYQVRLREGQNAIRNAGSAAGGLMSGATLKALTRFAGDEASKEYGAAFDRFSRQQGFNRGVYQDDRDTTRRNYDTDRAMGYDIFKDARNYDEAKRRYDESSAEDKRRYEMMSAEDRRRYDLMSDENRRKFDLEFDYKVATGDRDFDESVRRNDLGFNYNAAVGDRDTALNTLKFLAGLGSNNTGAAAGDNRWISDTTGANNLTGAGANAQGTTGQANIINQIINTILAQLSGNKLVNSLP